MSASRSEDPRIDEAGLQDLDALVALERACFHAPWSRESLAEELREPSRRVLVARVEGALVGYADLRLVLDEAELLRLAVAPERRGRGHGRILLRRGIKLVAEAGAVLCRLEVDAENVAAIELYRRLGFVDTGRRRAYYRNGGDALEMTLDPIRPS